MSSLYFVGHPWALWCEYSGLLSVKVVVNVWSFIRKLRLSSWTRSLCNTSWSWLLLPYILLSLPSVPLAASWNMLAVLYRRLAFSSGSSRFSMVLPCLILSPPLLSFHILFPGNFIYFLAPTVICISGSEAPPQMLFIQKHSHINNISHLTSRTFWNLRKGIDTLKKHFFCPGTFGLRHMPILSLVDGTTIHWSRSWESSSLDLRTKMASL